MPQAYGLLLVLPLSVSVLAGVEATAFAQAPTDAPAASAADDWQKAPSTWRNGFMLGLAGGLSFGSVSGYPNDIGKIGNPAYRSEVSGLGSGGGFFIGGALTDWFNFTIGSLGGSVRHGHLMGTGGGVVFRVEAFPLFAQGHTWRDVGLFAEFGTGTTEIRRDDGVTRASGGSMSLAGLGAFWEVWNVLPSVFGQHLATGPYASFDYAYSSSVSEVLGTLGFRTVYYGGP